MALKEAFDVRTGEEKNPMRTRQSRVRKSKAVLLNEKLLKLYSTPARQEWAKNALDDILFENNVQWKAEHERKLREREQMPSVENMIYPAVQQAVGMLTTNAPRFTATAKEGSDADTASAVADLMEHIWYHSRGNTQFKTYVHDGFSSSMGCMLAYFDPNKDFGNGEICLKAVDPLDVYIDPNSTDPFARDAEHILIVEYLAEARIEAMYPELRNLLEVATPSLPQSRPSSDRVASEGQTIGRYHDISDTLYEVIDRYSRIKIVQFKAVDSTRNGAEVIIEDNQNLQAFLSEPIVQRVQGGRVVWVTDQMDVAHAMELIERTGGVYHMIQDPMTGEATMQPGPEAEDDLAIPGSEVALLQDVMKTLVDQGLVTIQQIISDRILRVFSVGGVEAYNDYLPNLNEYPITFWMHDHNRNPYPQSAVRKARPIQEYVNKTQSLIVAHAANSTNVKVFYPRGSVNKEEFKREFGKAGFGGMEYDPELGIPIVVAPVPLPNELYHNKEKARESIYEIFGIYPLMQGDTSNAPDTYRGTLAIEEFGQRRIKSKREDIEESLNHLGRAVVQMIQVVYTKPKVLRLIQPNNQTRESKLNYPLYDTRVGIALIGRLNDVTIGEYDIIVVSGSTLPTNRWARFDAYMELFDRGIVDQVEVLKQTDVTDLNQLLERAGHISQMEQTIQGLQEEVKRLGGDLQTAQRESVQDRKRVEVEKFKTKLGRFADRAESATLYYQKSLQLLEKEKKMEGKEKPKSKGK